MKKLEYRYSNYLDNRIISESNWLLQTSNGKGEIYDQYLKTFVSKSPYTFLLPDTFLYCLENKRRVSEQLALVEFANPINVIFSNRTAETLLFAICLNPNIKIVFTGDVDMKDKKTVINKETGVPDLIKELETIPNQEYLCEGRKNNGSYTSC